MASVERDVANLAIPSYGGGASIVSAVCGYSANNSIDSSSLTINEEAQALRTSLTPYQLRLISAWEYSETSNQPAVDSRGSNHLDDNNAVPRVTGLAANDATAARYVAGNLDYHSRPAGTITGIDNKTTDFTIEIAFYLNAVGVIQTLFAKGGTADNVAGVWLFISATNRLQATIGNGTSRVSLNPATTLSASTLYHLVVSFDRDGNAVMYLNGSSIGSTSIAGVAGSLGSSSNLTIGQTSGVTYLSADVSYVRFWDGLLDSGTDVPYVRNSGNLRSYAQL